MKSFDFKGKHTQTYEISSLIFIQLIVLLQHRLGKGFVRKTSYRNK